MKKKCLICFLTILCIFNIFCFASCKPEKEEEEHVNVISEITESKYVNVYGRYYKDDANESVVFPNIASGIEVKFYGTELTAVMARGDSVKTAQGYNARFSVLVDGDIDTEAHSIVLRSSSFEDVTLISGLKEGWHTVKVMKKDASNKTHLLVKSVSTDGYFGEAPAKPVTKIMVYGDSITEGALMKSDVSMSLDVRNDGLSTYIMKPILEHGYEANVFARDGAVLTCEWENEPGKNTLKNFDKVSYDSDVPWDMTKFVPDVIVIYLGTNDRYAGGNQEQFDDAYVEFIDKLTELYGKNVKFILCHGAMNDLSLDGVVSQLGGKAKNVSILEFAKCKGGENSIGHPLLAEHLVYAEQMKTALTAALNHNAATQSYKAVSGNVTGNDEAGYTMVGRSVMTTVDDTIISADENFELSFDLKFSGVKSELDFKVGVNVTFNDNNEIAGGYFLKITRSPDAGKVQIFGENVYDGTKITEPYDIAESLSSLNEEKTYSLKIRWVGNEISVFLDDAEIARGGDGVDRTSDNSKLYFVNTADNNVLVSNVNVEEVAKFKAISGDIGGNARRGYTMNGKSVMSLAANTVIVPEEDYQISMRVRFDRADGVCFRVGINVTKDKDGNAISGYCLTFAMRSDARSIELFGENLSDGKAITDSKYTVCSDLSLFDWTKTYELKLTWIGNSLTIYFGGEKVAFGNNGVNRSVSPSTLYIWNDQSGATVRVKSIAITKPDGFEKLFGTVSGSDAKGYAIKANSAVVQVNEKSIYNAEIGLEFSVAAKGWPNLRIMLGGKVNDAGTAFKSGSNDSGISIGITSDGNIVTLGISSRNDWKNYFSATLCSYADFKFDTFYSVTIKITDGKNIAVTLGNIYKEIDLDDNETIPKDALLSFWNPGVQETTVKNVTISEGEKIAPENSYKKPLETRSSKESFGVNYRRELCVTVKDKKQ